MNLQERLIQCQKDKEMIEEQERELIRQIKQEEVTFANVAKFTPACGGRLILYLSPRFVEEVKNYAGSIVSFDRNGVIQAHSWKPPFNKNDLRHNYTQSKIKMIFEQ